MSIFKKKPEFVEEEHEVTIDMGWNNVEEIVTAAINRRCYKIWANGFNTNLCSLQLDFKFRDASDAYSFRCYVKEMKCK